MRRKYLIAIVIILLAVPHTAVGQPVSNDEAARAAMSFISQLRFDGSFSVAEVTSFEKGEENKLLIVKLNPEGWIIVSGDKVARPVLAYSMEDNFIISPNPENSAMHWLSVISDEIELLIKQKGIESHPEWNGYSKSALISSDNIAPLIEMRWNQGEGWNQYCPPDPAGPGGRTYVGCVAVAMGQALSVFAGPLAGESENTYDHDVYGTITTSYADADYRWDLVDANQANENSAFILYHCATSVEMDFGPSSSSATTSHAATAMPDFFRMSKEMKYILRLDYPVSTWKNMLRDELAAGRPVIYRGRSDDGESGHAFNVDGVQNVDYFHINWGWGGSNNGYYLLEELNPTATRSYNRSQGAIIGIQPYNYPLSVALSDTVVYTGIPQGMAVGKILVEDESTSNSYTFSIDCDSLFINNEWVRDYYIDGDSLRTSRMFQVDEKSADTIRISLVDLYGNTVSSDIILAFREMSVSVESERAESIILYPNPVEAILTMSFRSDLPVREVVLFNSSGIVKARFSSSDLESGYDISWLPPGLYIAEIIFHDSVRVRKKIIKKSY